jgi:SPP1 gp7 family putative phage head morphogenesis protein
MQRIANARAERRAARAFDPPAYFAGVYRTGIGDQSQPSANKLLSAHTGWQAIASTAIAQRLSMLELEVVMETRERRGTTVNEVLDDHPLVAVWDANPIFSLAQLLALMGFWLSEVGEAYFLKVTDRLRLPRELWPLSPGRMEIVTDRDVGIRGYVFHGEAGDFAYEANEVVRIFRPDPRNPFAGVGNLGPQALAYDAGVFLDETIRDHYQRDAIPKVALKASENASPPGGDALKRFNALWRQRYQRRGGSHTGLPAFLPPGFDVVPFPAFGGVTENVELMDRMRDRILMANGVPRSVLGDVVDANRAAAETNQWVFDAHTITPLTALIADALTRQVARDYDAALRVRFADFAIRDKGFELQQESADLQTKVRSVNQVREDRGLDPVPWGEEPIGSFADIPYRPEDAAENAAGAFGPPGDDPAAMDDGEESQEEGDQEEDRTRRPRQEQQPLGIARNNRRAAARSNWDPAVTWRRYVATEQRFRPEFERAIRQVLAQQRDAVLEALDAFRGRAEPDDVAELLGLERWARLFGRLVEPIRRRLFKETGEDVLVKLGTQQRFAFGDRVEAILARQAAELLGRTTDTTRRAVRRAIADGVGEGEGIEQIASRIREVFRTRRDHARTIARTEVLRGSAAAHLEGFSQAGFVAKKRWNTSLDDAVRDSHAETDGQVVELDAPFVLGDGEHADGPGLGANGAALSAANAINCRCFVTPVFDSEVS